MKKILAIIILASIGIGYLGVSYCIGFIILAVLGHGSSPIWCVVSIGCCATGVCVGILGFIIVLSHGIHELYLVIYNKL
jgi:hypothetical protein